MQEIKIDRYLHWNITNKCNFSCKYCFNKNKAHKRINISKIISKFNNTNKTYLITFTGGEPFLAKNFIILIEELSKKHYIRIDTNLSILNKCEEFIERINPKRIIEIHFSIHPEERKKINDGINKLVKIVKKFKKNNFPITGSFVMYPPLVNKFEKYEKIFNEIGVKIYPEFYQGNYKFKNYPFNMKIPSYDNETYKLILEKNPKYRTKYYLSKNETCAAGQKGFFVNEDGTVYLCHQIKKKLGNISTSWKINNKPIICKQKTCFCQFNKKFPSQMLKNGLSQLLNNDEK